MPPPAPTDLGEEWKLTEVMRNRRMSSLNPGEISRRSHRFILCFSARSSDVEFGVCVRACEHDERGSGKRGGQRGKKHTQAQSSSEQEQRGAGSPAGSGNLQLLVSACACPSDPFCSRFCRG